MIRLIRVHIPIDYDGDAIIAAVCRDMRITPDAIGSYEISELEPLTKSKPVTGYTATVTFRLKDCGDEPRVLHHSANKRAMQYDIPTPYMPPIRSSRVRPVVVGFGPAGIFAALTLAQAGLCPIVLERGKCVDERRSDIDIFNRDGTFNGESNIQFGEGGAGAFSDGKLKVGAIDPVKLKILTEFVEAGAPESIMLLAKPHIGSDKLPTVVSNIRKKIVSLGGNVIFGAKFTKILTKDVKLYALEYEKDGERVVLPCEKAIFATGHSARDTFEYFHSIGVPMRSKGFGVGVRIEHPQEYIDRLIYGADRKSLGLNAADYKLVTHLPDGRTVYTFCMCPGGTVVGAAGESGMICTNGMSEYARDGCNANTAMLVSVTPKDFGGDPLAGIAFQRRIESRAYAISGSYRAPVQRLEDFIGGKCSRSFGDVKPTYLPGTVFAQMDNVLPEFISDALRAGLYDMFDWLKGYYLPDALLTAPETRTTSPVLIERGENYEIGGFSGVYPCGEGAGYAGGIVSSAADGVKCAISVIEMV
ncbi:MAG: hypothetical protein MJ101_03705 [Clostridia bacterium]|nr:hypothetical protein [Clostridia bacterium]